MELKPLAILVPILLVYVGLYFVTIVINVGSLFYPIYIVSWLSLAFFVLALCRLQGVDIFKWRFNRDAFFTAIYIGIVQVFAYFFLGLLSGFAKSPNLFTPSSITISALYFVSIILGTEFSRAFFLKSFSKRNVFFGFVMSTLVFTFINVSLIKFITLTSTNAVQTLGTYFIPALGMSVLASGLVLLGGPIASISYLLIVQGFNWLSPILPNITWVPLALVETLIPILGVVVLFSVVSPYRLHFVGLMMRKDIK